jgi:hypothetical protein
MNRSKGARPGQGPSASAITKLMTLKLTTSGMLFHRLRHVRSLGPRVVGKILLWLVPDRGALLRELRCYVRFDPAFIRTIGAADWVELRALVRKAGP